MPKKINNFNINNCDDLTESMLRVDHAGEYGAVQICRGQVQALKENGEIESVKIIKEIQKQEEKHLATFEKLLDKNNINPTVLQPLWHIIAYNLGYLTGKLGKRVAMACTVAIEEVIEQHYSEQLEELNLYSDKENLKKIVAQFLAEEIEHKNISIDNEAYQTPFYGIFSNAIKCGSKLAIWLSKRV